MLPFHSLRTFKITMEVLELRERTTKELSVVVLCMHGSLNKLNKIRFGAISKLSSVVTKTFKEHKR